MNIDIGPIAKKVRDSIGVSQRDAAKMLGVSPVHLCNIEKGKVSPSPALIDRYRELWDVDIYILAWCTYGDISKLPSGVQKSMEKLSAIWMQEIASKGIELGELCGR